MRTAIPATMKRIPRGNATAIKTKETRKKTIKPRLLRIGSPPRTLASSMPRMPEWVSCPDCDGTKECDHCEGTGEVRGLVYHFCNGTRTCFSCDGSGCIPKD